MNSETKWETLLRYRLIEVVTLWEGRLTTKHLCAAFGIKRQQASRDINAYQEITGHNLVYDRKLRGYRPSKTFKPRFSKGTADEYLQMLEHSEMLDRLMTNTNTPPTPTLALKPPTRPVNPQVLRQLVHACRERRFTRLVYASRSAPSGSERLIVPHSIVYDGKRWHVRAWCEKRKAYRDFVIGRVLNVIDISARSDRDGSDDLLWHETVELVLKPNPDLPTELKEFHARDWGMQNNELRIPARKATVQYLYNLLGLDTGSEREQEVILANRGELEPYLFL